MSKKSLGQNFLTDKNKIDKIINALDLKGNDVVIEIGPGHGELTNELITFNKKLKTKNGSINIIAIEKDEQLAEELRKNIGIEKNNIEIITGDALKILPPLIHDSLFKIQGYKLVGNIPYYITGFLLRVLGELENKPKTIVLTIQKEVAERICAQPPKNNLLAASVQFWARPEIIDIIPRKFFNPAPKVDSAIVRLKTINIKQTTKDLENYYKFIKILFKQPRKTVLNNLAGKKSDSKLLAEKLIKFGVNPTLRPQDLSLKDIARLSSNGL